MTDILYLHTILTQIMDVLIIQKGKYYSDVGTHLPKSPKSKAYNGAIVFDFDVLIRHLTTLIEYIDAC